MIVYGWKSKRLLDEPLTGVKCNNCEETNTLSAVIHQRYFHLFWIPFIPIGKESKSHCSGCGKEISPKRMPLDIREAYERAKVGVRTPWYTFSGVALLAILIASIAIQDAEEKAQTAEWIKAPHSKDIIEYKTETGNYSILQVYDVVDDSVIIYLHTLEYNLPSGVDELKKMEDGWERDALYTVHKQLLIDMFENDEILGIDRTFE